MTNDETGERGRLARCVTRLAGHHWEFFAGAPKVRAGLAVAGGAPALPVTGLTI